ncbi:uncharacterized protein LY89DRAFT_668179 [Mollisia scopiformis]|uniref:Uncharacterized protein n=1 Tax=Mollisia scopiformis TaxID=149040 RepID=A0A194XCS7_MOLSC|nr:uncharacterized protein LY89DRAFT_668179 [Mollisia scopiformis]KUJ17975.1 hypothetical protein LY89DRAFT_668179 [Mollisia scopiformis]
MSPLRPTIVIHLMRSTKLRTQTGESIDPVAIERAHEFAETYPHLKHIAHLFSSPTDRDKEVAGTAFAPVLSRGIKHQILPILRANTRLQAMLPTNGVKVELK